jgi:hypothetical protein
MSYSGLISLKTPLDYEKLDPSINGKIQLYVQAVDFGIPSLNTTCVVEIIVQVSCYTFSYLNQILKV